MFEFEKSSKKRENNNDNYYVRKIWLQSVICYTQYVLLIIVLFYDHRPATWALGGEKAVFLVGNK